MEQLHIPGAVVVMVKDGRILFTKGYAVQSVSGTDFRDYLNRNIFRPLGMRRTSITAVPVRLQSDLATGYEYSGNSYHPLGFEYFHTYPASDVNSTATDMAHFMLAHLEGGRYFPAPSRTERPRPQSPQLCERLDRFVGRYRADSYCHTCPEEARGYVPAAFDITVNDDCTISFWGGRWSQVEPLLFQLVSGQLDNGEVIVAFREDRSRQITHMLNAAFAHEGCRASPRDH